MHNTDSAITQLETAHSEAIMHTMETGEPATVQLTPLCAAQILDTITTLQTRNTTLGARYAAAQDANERILAHARALKDRGQPDHAYALTRLITENPLVTP